MSTDTALLAWLRDQDDWTNAGDCWRDFAKPRGLHRSMHAVRGARHRLQKRGLVERRAVGSDSQTGANVYEYRAIPGVTDGI